MPGSAVCILVERLEAVNIDPGRALYDRCLASVREVDFRRPSRQRVSFARLRCDQRRDLGKELDTKRKRRSGDRSFDRLLARSRECAQSLNGFGREAATQWQANLGRHWALHLLSRGPNLSVHPIDERVGALETSWRVAAMMLDRSRRSGETAAALG